MSFAGRAADRLRHLVLPAGTLALLVTAGIARYQRAELLRVLPEDYVQTRLIANDTQSHNGRHPPW